MSARRLLRLISLAALVGLGACSAPQFGAPDAATDQGSDISSLYRGMVVAALVVGAIVWALIGWSLVRYRRRGRSDIPSQRSLHIPIEIAYTAVPVLIVALLFLLSTRTQRRVDKLDPNPDVKVEVIGFQWQWQFRYPDEGVTVTGDSVREPPELVLPMGQTTELRLVTADVNHSFWVPRFLYKRDLIKGVRNAIDVRPIKAGSFAGRCAEYCGLDHWRMNFTVRVVSPAAYRAWLAERKKGAP